MLLAESRFGGGDRRGVYRFRRRIRGTLIDEFDNLLVVQTLSKSRALAGLRVGVAMGMRDLIEAWSGSKIRLIPTPWMWWRSVRRWPPCRMRPIFAELPASMASRERLSAAMDDLGFEVLPSRRTLFCPPPRACGSELFAALRERGIIVRYFDKPRIDEFLRISMGTDAAVRCVAACAGRAGELAAFSGPRCQYCSRHQRSTAPRDRRCEIRGACERR